MLSKGVFLLLTVAVLVIEIEAHRSWRERWEKCYPKCNYKSGCRKVRTEKLCHKCVCEPVCTEPKCKEGCTIENLPGEPCPFCVCKEEEVPAIDSREGWASCHPKCDKSCRKAFASKWCYKCDCEPVCSELKCKEECSPEKLPGESCPSCVCKEEDFPALDSREAWARCFPKCGKGCRKVFTSKKCYKCECEPVCEELKCNEGCAPEKLPGESCPSCVCKEEEIPALDSREAWARCHPKCGKGCRKVFTSKKCYKCECEPACDELKCDEGCAPEKLPGESCPTCVCKEEELPVLDVGEAWAKCHPRCEKGCRKKFTVKGCHKCECQPLCEELKCNEGCVPEKLPGESCPSCVCKEEEIPALDSRESWARCYPKCGKGCRKVLTAKKCYKCECQPGCEELKCNEGCVPEKLPGESCPSCVCKEEELPALDSRESWARCYPKCGKGCRKVLTAKKCYKCECQPVCEELKCNEGCAPEKFPGESCPSCVCKEEEIPALDSRESRARCYPKCGKGCQKKFTVKGCHKCECQPVCEELKCNKGCVPEKLPGEPCPSCVCKEEEIPALDFGEAFRRCYPKCEKSCRKVFTANTCYKCDCEPACAELKCKEGCAADKLPGESCPSCVCREEDLPALAQENGPP